MGTKYDYTWPLETSTLNMSSSLVPEERASTWSIEVKQNDQHLTEENLIPNKKPFDSMVCKHPGCPYAQTFKRASDYKKHMEKHLRPYRCTVKNCESKYFGNAGDLKRHEHSVHGDREFLCPIARCARHRKGLGGKITLPNTWNVYMARIGWMRGTW